MIYLENDAKWYKGDAGVVVGMRRGRLQHVAELVRVSWQQRQVHHTLS